MTRLSTAYFTAVRLWRRAAGAALGVGLLAALLTLRSGQGQSSWQWYTVDLHSHSAVSADAYVDLGIIAENAKNGGYSRPDRTTDNSRYVVDTGAYGFFQNLKAAALILNKTDAVIAGTELGGFDTHSREGAATGTHANLQRRIGWAIYALRKYFRRYADKATWENTVVVTLSEFGRTTIENSDNGTDHAEAGVMFVAGGPIKGYGKGNANGVFGCHPSDTVP